MRTPQEIETEFAPRNELEGMQSFALVGIGGAGMVGIAKMLRNRGFQVKGTDSNESATTQCLRELGIQVVIGHTGSVVSPGDAVIVTDAIDLKKSPEVAQARTLGCPLFRRSQALGWLLKEKKTIAITGTHGKTTTTGFIGAGLRSAGLDPTIVVGAEVPELGGSVSEGQGEFAVVEACEAYDALRDLDPYIAVLTNLELDHIDFHGSWSGLVDRMDKFVSRLPSDGALVFCADDEGAHEFAGHHQGSFRSIGYGDNSDVKPVSMDLSLPGQHNRLNATAAKVVFDLLNLDENKWKEGLATFHGAKRRLEVLKDDRITLIDDYAHHPTEIRASLHAVKERYGNRRVVVVFQPHLYSRTEPLIQEFAQSLSIADFVVITDIYPAREDPIPGVSSFRITEAIEGPCLYVPQRHLLPRKVMELTQEGDVVVAMGAGNIDEFPAQYLAELGRFNSPLAPPGQKPRIGVLYGGDSAEREVSILSGRAIATALRNRSYQVDLIDASELLLNRGNISVLTGIDRPDMCFLAVHGTHAEDGAIQGLLELIHIPYSGSGIRSSAVAMDKHVSKEILRSAGLIVPDGTQTSISTEFDIPESNHGWVVKPNSQGSTVGLSFVRDRADLQKAVEKALEFDHIALIEELVLGMEISVPVLGDRALIPVEIVPVSGTYDFESKYTPGATEEVCPARLSDLLIAETQRQALIAHKALGCQGCTRTDMIVDGDRIVCLEVNTLPGMTETSLFPKSASVYGMSFADLCEWIVKDAIKGTSSR